VGVTGDNWYWFRADRPGMTEVNFWQPAAPRVPCPGPGRAVLRHPYNLLVPGGFSDLARLRVSEAWEFFGEASGVASFEEM